MRRLTHPGTAIALLALFVALGGGTVWAAGSLISGSQIKKHSIPASKLTAGAIKAVQGDVVRWNTTGTTVRDVVGTTSVPDLTNLSDRTGIVTLATVGTFKVEGICWNNGTNTYAATFVETTQDGASTQGYSNRGKTPQNVADGPVRVSEDVSGNTSAYSSFLGSDDGSWVAMNAAGSLILNGFGTQAVPNLNGGASATCDFSGFLVRVAG